MTPRGLLFRLLAVTLSVALVVGAAELLLRLSRPAHGFVATGLRTNHAGGLPFQRPDFRDRPPPGVKAPGTFRILMLGDSFVWGSGVHPADAYPRRLERQLALLDSQVEFEVVSWSRSGWNTRHAWRSVRRSLRRLEPDLVILGFTLNDPEPNGHSESARLTEPLRRRSPQGRLATTLYERSAFFRLVWDRLENRRQRRAFTAYYRALFTGPHWQSCRQAMLALRDATRARGVPLLLVVMPVFDSQFDRTYAYRRHHRKVGRAAEELEIPVLDLLGTFRRVDARRLAVVPFTDPHPNELAHRIAADELLNYLVDEQMVPASFSDSVPRTEAVRRR